jgi:hypothetical protein
MNSEAMPEIMQAGLIASVLAAHPDVLPQSQESILYPRALHWITVLIGEKRCCRIPKEPFCPAINVVIRKNTAQLGINSDVTRLVELCQPNREYGVRQIYVGTGEIDRFAHAKARTIQQQKNGP